MHGEMLDTRLGFLPPRDFELGSDNARRPAVVAADDFAPHQHPDQATILVAQAILALVDRRLATEMLAHALDGPGAIGGVDGLPPEPPGNGRAGRHKTQHFVPSIGDPDRARPQVPIPQSFVAAVERQRQPLLADAQPRLALPESFFGAAALGDVEVETDNANGLVGFGVDDDAAERQQPTISATGSGTARAKFARIGLASRDGLGDAAPKRWQILRAHACFPLGKGHHGFGVGIEMRRQIDAVHAGAGHRVHDLALGHAPFPNPRAGRFLREPQADPWFPAAGSSP